MMNRKSKAYEIQRGTDYISISKTIVKEYGLLDAYVLALLSYKQKSFGEWFFYDINDLAKDCSCSAPVIRKAMERLEKNDMIAVERSGYKGKLHYLVRAGVVSANLQETTKQDLKKEENTNERNNKTHTNNKVINNKLKNEDDYSCSNTSNTGLSSSQSHGTAVGAKPLFPSTDEKKKQPKRNSNDASLIKKIDSPFYKMIRNIIQENSDLSFGRHRLPDKKNPVPTKLIVHCVEYLEQYARGEFGKNKVIESHWASSLILSMSADEVERDVVNALQNWRYALNEAYMPVNKDFIKRIPLDTWFYNGNTQRSWFLEMVHTFPKLKSDLRAEQIQEQLPPEINKVFSQFYLSDKSPNELLEYWQNLKTIYDKWRLLTSDMKYGDWYKNSNWLNYFRGLEQFCQSYFDFIKDYPHPLHILSTCSDTWRKYENYVWKEFRVNLSPGPKGIEELKKRQEEDSSAWELKQYQMMMSQASISWRRNLEEYDMDAEDVPDDDRDASILSGYLYNCVAGKKTELMYEYAQKLMPQVFNDDGTLKERFKDFEKDVFLAQFCKKN